MTKGKNSKKVTLHCISSSISLLKHHDIHIKRL